MRTCLAILCLLAATALPAQSLSLDFARDAQALVLTDGAEISHGILRFNGHRSKAVVKGTEGFHVGPQGLTVSCVARFPHHACKAGQDMIFKPGEFYLCRYSNNQLTGYLKGKTWCGRTAGGNQVKPITAWGHYAMTILPVSYPGEGKSGYCIRVYVNGEQEAASEVFHQTILPGNAPIQLGRGNAGDAWAMRGEMARFSVHSRALTEDEIQQEARQTGLVTLNARGKLPIPPDLQKQLHTSPLPPALKPWLTQALERALKNGADQAQIATMLQKLPPETASAKTPEELAAHWNSAIPEAKILCSKSLCALFILNVKGTHSPLVGLYDRNAKTELLGRHGIHWSMAAKLNGKTWKRINSFDPGLHKTAQLNGKTVTVTYQNQDVTAALSFTLTPQRLEMDLQAQGQPHCRLETVTFPILRLARKTQGQDQLLWPCMNGVLVDNPTEMTSSRVKQNWYYPSTYISMQFGAYYDDRSGVYFAMEDPQGAVKRYISQPRGHELESSWEHFVPYENQQTGGNRFQLSGPAVVQTFTGNWYDAAQLYKDFTIRKAQWRIPDLPRKDSPQWFRNNTLWILMRPLVDHNQKDWPEQLVKLKNYFELPYGVHLYDWFDLNKGHLPHFYAEDSFLPKIKFLRQNGLYVKPYLDTRIWAEKDGGWFQKDWQYSSHARKFAVKNADGSLNYELYDPAWQRKKAMGRKNFAIMCAGDPAWRQWFRELCRRVHDYGMDALYHDELAAARPWVCFDPNHGHKLNDPTAWVHGNQKALEAVRKDFPNLPHDTEEACEPYLAALDGFMCWRWRGLTPVFQSIYHGRTQITGRHFMWPNWKPDYFRQQFFVKAADQLVSAEQLGWFFIVDMRHPDRRVYIKRLMHLRQALLPYFNEGCMLRPLTWTTHPGTLTCDWGAMQGQGGIITTPKVLAGVYSRSNGLKVAIFVNTSDDTVTCQPDLTPYGETHHEILGTANSQLTIPPRETALILMGDPQQDAFQAERHRLTQVLERLRSFQP